MALPGGDEPVTAAMPSDLLGEEVHRETIIEDWADYNGHMNLAYYVLVFDFATDALYPRLGLGHDYMKATNCSTFTLETHTTYQRELMVGAEVICTTQLIDFDEKRMHYLHRMYHAEEGFLSATTECMAVHVDLGERKVVPMPDGVQAALSDMLARHRAWPSPEEAGRIIGIRRK